MKLPGKFVLVLFGTALAFGCATAPEVIYVTEAQQVTSQALEPVYLIPGNLEKDLKTWKLPPEMLGMIMNTVSEQVEKTKRFTKVIEGEIAGNNTYVIQPGIDSLSYAENLIPTDPTRKKVIVKARVRLDVKYLNDKGEFRQFRPFSDLRTLEQKISSKIAITNEQKNEYYTEAIEVGYKAAANLMGVAFNPSYVTGKISKLNGRVADIQINTSKLRHMPKKEVEVIDDNGKVLAVVDELKVNDGAITGKIYEKSGSAIKEGSKVRAKINDLTE
ncbi:MAG TPA: hypothetical protein VGJ93_09120 [Desulfuromonadaceae bacterium]|jgi:hypothetical protein